MNKELTPLEVLEDIILYLSASEPKGLYCKNIEIIKTALKDYEELKKENKMLVGFGGHFFDESFKQNKALKIIRKKFVDIARLINSNNVDEYNKTHYDDLSLTKEEFDLLKEVLL